MGDGLGVTRREFVAGVAAGVVVALPVLSRVAEAAPAEAWVATVKPEELPAGSYKLYAKDKFILSRTGDVVIALSAVCSHQQCAVKPGADRRDKEKNLLVCPCHGGRFDASGKPFSGPPKKALSRLEVRLGAGGVIEVNVGSKLEGEGMGELKVGG